MDRQPILGGATFTLRPVTQGDRAGLFTAAADPETWAGHPAHDRWQKPVFDRYFDMLLASGETLVVERDDEIIGCSRFYTPPEDAAGIAIGFTFLRRDCWGGPTNRDMKRAMLTHAVGDHDTVWFHISPDNIRSQKAIAKLGAAFVEETRKTVGGMPGTWRCYRLDRNVWEG